MSTSERDGCIAIPSKISRGRTSKGDSDSEDIERKGRSNNITARPHYNSMVIIHLVMNMLNSVIAKPPELFANAYLILSCSCFKVKHKYGFYSGVGKDEYTTNEFTFCCIKLRGKNQSLLC